MVFATSFPIERIIKEGENQEIGRHGSSLGACSTRRHLAGRADAQRQQAVRDLLLLEAAVEAVDELVDMFLCIPMS